MAYLLRSLAVIGAIALNSPVHGTKSEDNGAASATLRTVAKVAGQMDARTVANGMTAAREAAQIMAGLDPQTRSRVLALALGAAKAEPPTRSPN